MKHRIIGIALLGSVLTTIAFTTSCDSFKPNTPEGFVAFEDITAKHWWQTHDTRSGYDYRAITPDGVVLAIRRFENDPKASIAYWSEAVQQRLRANGSYRVDSERDLSNHQGIPGHELTLKLGEGAAEQIYRVSLIEHGKWIYVLESGGSSAKVAQRTAAIDQAVQGISFD
jgi:hypothetical protein